MILFPEYFPVTCHTKHVQTGSTFVAIPGYTHDGTTFIAEAIEKGATTVVAPNGTIIEGHLLEQIRKNNIVLAYTDNPRRELAILSAQAADYPAKKLTIVGITGTKGKSSTAWMVYHVLMQSGYKTALLSTLGNYIGTQSFKAPLTTPQPDYIHQFLALALAQGVTHVVMEVAAQAVSLYRIFGISFAGIIMTNIDREHLEFYPDEMAYFEAKAALTGYVASPDTPIISGITGQWHNLLKQKGSLIQTCTTNNHGFTPDYAITITNTTPVTLTLNHEKTKTKLSIHVSSLIGDFNALNAGLASSMALNLGVLSEKIIQAWHHMPPVPGRLESYDLPNGARAIIDYAHNPLSYRSVLPTLRTMTDHLIVVCGAGGDRDPGRRATMGLLAATYGDLVILTSDNPRSENPVDIIAAMQKDLDNNVRKKIVVRVDRKEAIHTAYQLSRAGAIIALLGKGPDEYQIVGTTTTRFSEKEILHSL